MVAAPNGYRRAPARGDGSAAAWVSGSSGREPIPALIGRQDGQHHVAGLSGGLLRERTSSTRPSWGARKRPGLGLAVGVELRTALETDAGGVHVEVRPHPAVESGRVIGPAQQSVVVALELIGAELRAI